METLVYLIKYIDGKTTLIEIINSVMSDFETEGFDILNDKKSGHYAEFRAIDLAEVINRIRDINMVQI